MEPRLKRLVRVGRFPKWEWQNQEEVWIPSISSQCLVLHFHHIISFESLRLLSNLEYLERSILLFLISFHSTWCVIFLFSFSPHDVYIKPWLYSWLLLSTTLPCHCYYAQSSWLRGNSSERKKTKILKIFASMGLSGSGWWTEHISLYGPKEYMLVKQT